MDKKKYNKIIQENPYKPELKRVLSRRQETLDSFTIRLNWQLDHKPGQFVFCSLPGIGEAPISICSDSREYVELNIRQVGNVTNALAHIQEGDDLLVRGPYGTWYPMEELKGNNLVIIGGGCGVAPLKGIIEYLETHRGEYGDIDLFLGFRTPSDVLFNHRQPDWKKLFTVHVSYDKMEKTFGESCIEGTEGFITQLVQEHVKDTIQKIVFICGPPIMIEKTIEILKEKGFHDDQIFLSAERLMYCGMGKCGRCMIHGHYTCLDGSVFRFDKLGVTKE